MKGPINRRSMRLARNLTLVLLPSLLAAIYFGFFAADQYVSESRFVVRDAADQPASNGLAQLAAQARESSAALAVKDYLQSRPAMAELRRKIDLPQVWRGGRDPVGGLASNASDEDLYRRYHDRVTVVVNGNSGVVTLRAQTFASADALHIVRQLLAQASQTLAQLSEPGGHLTMIVVVQPNLPDRPAEPQRLRIILTVFGFNLILVAMAWLLGTGLREHAAKGR